MVIDVKDDEGNITMKLNTGNKQVDKNTLDIVDGKKLLKNCIITIFIQLLVSLHLRILNQLKNILSGHLKKVMGQFWTNGKGDSFVNPFMKEVWDYDITVAKAAAKAGFQDIQFDYVRFPEGFENEADSLTYSKGDYKIAS